MTGEPSLSFPPFRLDVATESVWRDGEEIRLRPRTFTVLRHLAERPGRLVTKEELLQAVWGEVAVGDAALTVCIGEIRKALGDEARTPRFVETVHRRGYRFIGLVEAVVETAIRAEPPAAPRLVGREAELARLGGWLERALRGERQIVFVTGEPGIGKSALVEAFLASLPGADTFWSARGQCLDHYGAGEAYLPLLEALGRLARGSGGDRVVDVLGARAPTWLAQMPGLVNSQALARLQGRILGATRERMLREMAEALEVLAAERPLVLLLEDLHWSDPSTLDLLAAVARRRDPARLLLIGTYRPVDVIVRGHPLRTVTHELLLQGAGSELALELLGEADVGRYLTGRFGVEVGLRLAPLVHQRTDGLPLFMVNVVDALLRQGLLIEDAGGWRVTSSEVEVANVPENLRQMIEQQLAELGADEETLLAAASVAGMTFSSATVAAALEGELEAVEARCEALARREQFIRTAGTEEWPDGTVAARYRFLHVLYEHVLYERLPAARRANLHRRIGEREEAGFRARRGERAAALALHFERGRDSARAVRYHHEAADHELRRCAYPEALAHLGRGRELLEAVPDPQARAAFEFGLQMTLGPVLIAVRGSGASDVEAAYLRARDLAESLADPGRLFPALWGLMFVNYSRGRYPEAREIGERLLGLAECCGNEPGQLLEAHHGLWATLVAMGESATAVQHIERGLQLYDPERHPAQAYLYGYHDAAVCAWYHLASARWLLGYPDAALAALREARALTSRLEQPMTTMLCLRTTMWVHYHRGDVEDARACAREIVALGTTHGFSGWVDDGVVVLACTGERDSASSIRALFERARFERPGRAGWRNVACLCALARAAAELGDGEVAWEILTAIPAEHRSAFFAPEIERIRGEVLLQRGAGDAEAMRCFRSAIEIARHRSERALELRATTSLARVLARAGRRAEARRILGEIHGWFTEGFDTTDLREAQQLLATLPGGEGSPTSRG